MIKEILETQTIDAIVLILGAVVTGAVTVAAAAVRKYTKGKIDLEKIASAEKTQAYTQKAIKEMAEHAVLWAEDVWSKVPKIKGEDKLTHAIAELALMAEKAGIKVDNHELEAACRSAFQRVIGKSLAWIQGTAEKVADKIEG